MTRLFRYVPHARMPDALALGWLPVSIVLQTHHCHYSVLCERICECGRMPEHIGAEA